MSSKSFLFRCLLVILASSFALPLAPAGPFAARSTLPGGPLRPPTPGTSPAATAWPAAVSTALTLTVHPTVTGATTVYLGATEAGGFWSADLVDLGVSTYRLWTKMAELEWWDDDDAMDGQWDDSEYGTPSIAAIQADAASGFTNTVPWAWWDERFDEVQSWRYGLQTRREIVAALAQNDITPIVVLRTYDDQGQPEQRPAARWAPRPPVNDAFRNEWWEHCFAIAYWLNVRNDYGVTHFEVLNEPDWPGQGWSEYGGTMDDYAELVLYAHDAISYANSFAGLPVHLHAPVVANYSSAYIAHTLDNADPAVQVVDYHTYAADVRPSILAVRSTIDAHNPDAVHEPIWVSEWGALWGSYNTLDRALRTAEQLVTFSEEEVEGAALFNMYDWSTAPGQDYGLVDLQDDGQGGALRVPTESYYAFRLMARGLNGGKTRLEFTANGAPTGTRAIATRDAANFNVLLVRSGPGGAISVTVDLSPAGVGHGAATVYEYSLLHKDEIVATPPIEAGRLIVTAPAEGVSLVVIPRPGAGAAVKAASAPTAAPGERLTYTLVLSNSSAVAPFSTRLTDTLPAGVTWTGFLTSSAGSANWTAGAVHWTGAILPGIPVTVTYAVTISWQPAGTSITNSAVLHDQGFAPRQTHTVTTTVRQVAGVALRGDAHGTAPPGTTLSYTLTVTNAGNLGDTFTLAVSSTWPAQITPLLLALPMSGSAPVTLTVTIPLGAPAGSSDVARVTATSYADPGLSASAVVTTTATVPTWSIYLPLASRLR